MGLREGVLKGKQDVLILGSFPEPDFLARRCRRVVEEKDAVVGILGAGGHWVARCHMLDIGVAVALYGRKTGRKAERFIVIVVGWCAIAYARRDRWW
jgi:hypothetical protein